MCSLQDSGVINTFTHKTTVIPAFLQGSEVPCVTKLSNSSLAASSTPGSALFIKGRPTSAFAVVTAGLDFFIFQRALLLPSGFMFHHKETSKAEEEFQPSFLCAYWRNPDLCLGFSASPFSMRREELRALSLCAVQHRGYEYYILLFNCDIKFGVPTAGESTYLMWQIFTVFLSCFSVLPV